MLIASILRSAGHKTAMITTASVDFGDGEGRQRKPSTIDHREAKQQSF